MCGVKMKDHHVWC